MSAKAPRIYRHLLLLLPPRFRSEFGAELEAVMAERLRGAGGIASRSWIWVVAVADVVTSAAAEWARVLRHLRAATARRSNGPDRLALDVRFALRSLARQPGFTAIVVTTMGLGIGVSIAIFSVVNTVLLQPLPFPDAGRIVSIETFWTNTGRSSPDVSGPDFLDWQVRNAVFGSMAVYNGGDNLGNDFAIVVGDRATFGNVRFVSADFFEVFGQTAFAGRLLTERDVPQGSAEPTVAVASHRWAVTHFGSAAAAIRKTIAVYGTPVEIVGVAAPTFHHPGAADLWAPWRTSHSDRSHHTYRAVGKLAADVQLARAQAQMRTIGDNLAREHPENRFKTVELVPLQERMTDNVRVMLWVLMGAVALVLLIACANIANLLLGRGADRTREMALRAALGAGRGRVIRQLLTESCVLAGVAGLAGLLLAFVLVQGLVGLSPADLPRIEDVRVDGTVLVFAVGLTFVTALLFGLAPAIHASRIDLSHAMMQGGARGSTSGGARTRAVLVVAEVALAVMLLSAAGLLTRSFLSLQHVDLGFATERVLVATTEYAVSDLTDIRTRSRVYAELLERLRAVPGVHAAAGVAYLGMGREPRALRDYFVRGRPEGRPGERAQAELHAITPDYFETLEIPILEGRDFAASDAWEPGSPEHGRMPVAIINRTLARTAFPGESAIGERIRTNREGPWMEIVGIVGDTRWQDPGSASPPVIFVPSTQDWGNSLSILARTSMDDKAVAATLRELLHEANPAVPVRFESLEDLFAEAIAYPRFRTRLIGAFAAIAVSLAGVGIFSVLAYLVAQRTREIALRRAIGARTADVIRLVVGQTVRWIGLGLVVGLAGALSTARVLEVLLFEISPWDPATYAGGLVVIGGAALLATLIPVIRAAGIAPLAALQQE